ncbi:3',5'-cyclic adenosine monophosphate phosphodiesterase CpdA [Halopseudomonas oceani]|nr:3',5'-cyclic adenosine monophosphate phosphodiesterase CpdA [Halopseudomonas oceani]
MSLGSDFVCVVQLTDSHLFAEVGGDLLGLDTQASLDAVIDMVLEQTPEMDLVLATGDITQDGSEAAYRRFITASQRLPAPCCWIPGNHDDAELMSHIGDPLGLNRPWVDLGNWRIVMLDTSILGAVPGRLEPSQLAIVDDALSSVGERHVMVCLHHQPVDIGSDWMAPIGLLNPQDLLERIQNRSEVKVVLWGHIHQHFDQQLGHLRLLATPSTCVQFAAGSSDFAADTLAPGYRWMRLYDDGRIETAVSRLPEGVFLPEPGAVGY